MISLIVLDIDGTLLDSAGRVPQANIEALEKAIAGGVEIVLATGRRFDYARPVFERLPRPLTLILSNGAIVRTCAGETLGRRLLPREVARSVLGRVPEHRGSAALLFDRAREGQVVYERVDWTDSRHAGFFTFNRPYIAEVAPLESALTEDPLQVMFTGSCTEMRALFDRLQNAPDARASYSVALTEYLHRDFSLVDITQVGCSKGAALRDLAAVRGIDRSAIMAVGDNLNDLQMLEFAGHPVVMGNGLDDLKARGWRVTATNDEAGVAAVIHEMLEAGAALAADSDRSR